MNDADVALILAVVAAVLFAVSAVVKPPRIDLTAAGLFVLVLALVVADVVPV